MAQMGLLLPVSQSFNLGVSWAHLHLELSSSCKLIQLLAEFSSFSSEAGALCSYRLPFSKCEWLGISQPDICFFQAIRRVFSLRKSQTPF